MDLVGYAIESALKFNVKEITTKNIPPNVFGVFVSIERSDLHKKLANNENVHGCIGDWNDDYSIMRNDKIIKVIRRVSYEACWNDSRRYNFAESLYADMNSKFKIYFMQLPIYEIERDGKIKNKNEYFNNETYGLIVHGPRHRATYLPYVFDRGEKWDTIKSSLLRKAGMDGDQYKFMAYKATIIKNSLFNYLVSPIYTNLVKICEFIDFVPYMINSKGKIIIDKSQNVRNIATVYDLSNLEKKFKDYPPKIRMKMDATIKYYIKKYEDDGYDQSSIFLLLYLYTAKENTRLQERILKDIISRIDKMEPNFEQSEAFYVLSIIHKEKVNDYQKIFFDYFSKSAFTIEDIFRINWYTKAFGSILNKKILNIILGILEKIDTSSETNYIAVSLETISNILHSSHYTDSFNFHIERFMIELNKRTNGFYMFTNKTMRLDITGHVLESYLNML